MRMPLRCLLSAILVSLFVLPALCQDAKPKSVSTTDAKEWIKRSNENAQILLRVQAKYGPEFAARIGVQA